MLYTSELENAMFIGMQPTPVGFRPPSVGKNNKLSTRPEKCFGALCKNWNFRGRDEMFNMEIEHIETRPAAYYDELSNKFVPIQNKFITVGYLGDGQPQAYGYVSSRYEIVQDREVINIAHQALDDTGLEVGGRYISEGGHMNTIALIANPEYKFYQGLYGGGGDDYSVIGLRITNDHTGKQAFGVEAIGINHICWNFQSWGQVLGHMNVKHFKNADKTIDDVCKMIKSILKNTEVLKDKIFYLDDTKVDVPLPVIYAGLGFSPENMENILTYKKGLNPKANWDAPTLYDVYNAATAFLTYKSGSSAQGIATASKRVESLLVKDISDIINAGEKRLAKLREENKVNNYTFAQQILNY